MSQPLRIAVAGLGRMGAIHALHVHELASEGKCVLAALVDADGEKARRFADEYGCAVPIFTSLQEFAAAKVADATVLVTPTDQHRATATTAHPRRPARAA